MNGNLFVFRPGGPSVWNVFNDWKLLVSALSCVQGRKIIEFDDSLASCEIPAGIWPMKDVVWAGFGPRPGKPRPTVNILPGAEFTNFRMIGGQITIVNQVTAPAHSPISDFVSGPGLVEHVQIGMRDDCGNTQLVNQGNVPMFDLGGNSAYFFVQNCLFGMPSAGLPSTFPLIRQSKGSVLVINLLGQNQTGPNLVLSEGGSVLFGALSSAAQVAVDQTSITNGGGTYDFGPQGRIQRQVIPRPPAPPATASVPFQKPNVVIRCNGTVGFTQDLPAITTGFTISNGPINLYSGGQEVVVAEVAGGEHLSVRPTSGDTIDGSPGEVHIGKHGSRTFLSDGLSNWITISEVP
jgi:hypothetical protein